MLSLRHALVPLVLSAGLAGSAPTPIVFAPGIISTGDMDLNSTFTPDGRTVYFTKRTPKFQRWVIFVSHLKGSTWSEPVVAEFSGRYNDFDPYISPDGSKLYFSSARPVDGQPKRGFDTWVVERTANGWSEPRNLGAPVNADGDEGYPTVTADGTLYFTATREGGKGRGDIYRARFVNGAYETPENLGDAINSTFTDGDPYISPDENTLIFVSYGRPDGLGDGDLYISRRVNGVWTKAVNMGAPFNSPALDFCPIIAPGGKSFFFTSERVTNPLAPGTAVNYRDFVRQIRGVGNGFGDIYRIDASTLNGF